ncbi:hypothetical protein D3C71_1280910 [compost metagenome]
MIKTIHQRLAEERIVEVTDFLVGNTRAGIIDAEHQAIGVLGFMINHQRNLAAGGSDNRVMHQQRDHLAQCVSVTDVLLLDIKLEMIE